MGCIHCFCQQVQFPLQTVTIAYLCQALITVLYVKQVFLASKTRREREKKINKKPAVTHPSQQRDASPKEPCWAGPQLAAALCSSRQHGLLQQAQPPAPPEPLRGERGSRLLLGSAPALKPLQRQNASSESRNTRGALGGVNRLAAVVLCSEGRMPPCLLFLYNRSTHKSRG